MKWTKSQKNVVLAAYLGWTLDAFDFFLMVFMFKDVASTFHVEIKQVVFAVTLTLAARPIGDRAVATMTASSMPLRYCSVYASVK